eukprot:Protomagalhaensia_wolfi_Nauph_80__5700@NODE_675_length_2137_cov_19_119161_g502_i0_p1_GENE_NODE_675_length_2137_cov_19_119161_g502_i0NODE_675_length_2137_cov_19_119161_g502_i0_p1_ORF_typecomplete_len295_score45_19mTERF/PF02536_14/0_0062DnaGprimase_HBD/PF16730_5/0_15_NODE_675_length_2137_cov_19_119161_g502_i026886
MPHNTSDPPKAIYNRIASTLSLGQQGPNPWDLIEAVTNRPDLPYQIKPRPSNVSDTDSSISQAKKHEDDEESTSSSSFDLSEALEDIQQLHGMEGSDLIKPLEQLRNLLVSVAVPVKERVEILKNLQLRDSWLMFLAKHFRRVLTKIKKEEEEVDERVRRLQEIFGQIAESHLPLPQNPTTMHSDQPPGRPAVPPPPAVTVSVTTSVVTDPPPQVQPDPKQPPVRKLAQERESETQVFQVTGVPPPSMYPFCIKVIAAGLGRAPLDTSGLRHFSPSCERRARLRQA